MAKNIKTQLIDKGEVSRGVIGGVIHDLSEDLVKTFKLKNKKGVLISEVSVDSPAE